jgi:hypothetical protein
VLDYYRARVLDETTRRRCQDRNGTVVRAWHLAIALLPRWLRAPKGPGPLRAPFRTMTKREWTARPEM